MIRPVRFVLEYFAGTETSRWYRNQRVIATEHLPNGKKLDKYLKSSRASQVVNLGLGRVAPDIALITSLYHCPDSRYLYLALAGELLRVGSMIYHRTYRTPFLQPNRKIEIVPWKPEDSEGWKVEKPKTWEDEGEEWKNDEPKWEDHEEE